MPPKTTRRSNGEGTFYQRGDGLWVGRISIDGKLRQVSARTRTQAVQKLQMLKQRPFDASNQTVGEFLEDWLEEVCKPTLKPRTVASYADLVRLHIVPDLGHVKLSKLSAQHIQTWRNKKLASGRAPRTVLHMYAVLRTALNRAVKYELVQRNVALLVDAPTVKPADIHPLAPEQAARLLEVVQGQRFEHLYALLVSTGLRLGEAQALRWSDVDLEHSRVRVRHTMLMQPRQPWVLAEPKSDRSRRLVPLIGQAKAALVAQKDRQTFEKSVAGSKYTDHGLVFAQPDGEPVTASAVEHDFKRALTAAGLPRSHRPHDLRHSAATYLLAAGVPERIVMDFLGHSNLATTRMYEHVMDTMLSGAGDKLEAFLSGGQVAAV